MPYFEVKSPRRGAKLRLDSPFFVIGRGERIPIFHDDPSISREHAAVVIRKGGVRVRDLGSKNGVLLNGKPIGRYAEVALAPGDTVKIGATSLVLREGEPPVSVKPAGEKPAGEKPEGAKPDAERVAALAARRGAETILAGPDAAVRRSGAPEAVDPASSPAKGSHTMAVAAAASIGAALRAPEDPADAAEAAREGPSAPLPAPSPAEPASGSGASAEPVSATSGEPSPSADPAAAGPTTPAPAPESGSADAPTGRLVPDEAGSEPTAVMERTRIVDHPGALLPLGSETFRARPFEIGPEIPTGDRLRPVDEPVGSPAARPHDPLLVPESDETHSTLGEAEPPASLMASDEDDDALPVEFE